MLWNGDVGSCFESGHPFREAQARFVPILLQKSVEEGREP
jgi:hypothetical protein